MGMLCNRYGRAVVVVIAALGARVAHASTEEDRHGFYGRIAVSKSRIAPIDAVHFDRPGVLAPGGTGGSGLGSLGSGIPAGSSTLTGQYVVRNSPAIAAAMGYDFGAVRAEVEVTRSQGRVVAFNATAANGVWRPVTALDAARFCSYNSLTGCSASGNMIRFPNGPKLSQMSTMASAWFDIALSDAFVPYVGGGAGFTSLQVGTRNLSRFSWQIGGGLAWYLSDKMALTADYRHRQTNPSEIRYAPEAGINFGRIKTDNFSSGFKFKM